MRAGNLKLVMRVYKLNNVRALHTGQLLDWYLRLAAVMREEVETKKHSIDLRAHKQIHTHKHMHVHTTTGTETKMSTRQ